jgi:hypothetical protein
VRSDIVQGPHEQFSLSASLLGSDKKERSAHIGLALLEIAQECRKFKPDYRKSLQNLMQVEVQYRSIDDPYLTIYKDLACAEALRLTGRTEGALVRFDEVSKASQFYGYQLEKAHALLGTAATKLLRNEIDRRSCQEALKLYQKVGSTWGEIQALILQALIESQAGGAPAHLFHKAGRLAQNHSFRGQVQSIKNLAAQKSAAKERYALIFTQAV